MSNLETLKKQAADLEAKLEESTEQLKNMKAEIDRLENGWEMKPHFEKDEDYYYLTDDGEVGSDIWGDWAEDECRFGFGNTFKTLKEAELEEKRRKLLARFRAFRDECNNGWEPDWSNLDKKWDINYDAEDENFKVFWSFVTNSFSTFGYFKNEEDCKKAIDLFGDEIKELFV